MDGQEVLPKTILAHDGPSSEYLRSIFDREMQATVNNVELGSRRDEAMRNLTDEAANLYADRVVRELLQNAYDGASGTNDRRILLRLDLRIGHGVLYVANSGSGFAPRNVDAIVTPAMSDKKPGNFIGHKGLGFRSVELLTDDVQVFSMSGAGRPGADRFDGFRFRFARPADETEWLLQAGKKDLTHKVVGLVHRLQLPVALEGDDKDADSYAQDGYATLVRLPLRDAKAAAQVEAELSSFMNDDAPIVLFLGQLESLRIEVLRESGRPSISVLRRESKSVPFDLSEVAGRYEQVTVNDRRFIVGRTAVDLSRFLESVRISARQNHALERWLEWKQAPEVSVALPDSPDAKPGCFYAFLPMDKAPTPLNGFLDAPFYPKADRRSLDLTVPMNAFLLEACADLCLELAKVTAARNVRENTFRRSAVDAVAWHGNPDAMLAACERSGMEPASILLPCMIRADDSARWARADEISYWEDATFQVLKHRRIVKACGAFVLRSDLGKERTRSILEFLKHADVETEVDVLRWAEWAPKIALDLGKTKKFKKAEWEGFFKDLAHIPGLLPLLGGKDIFPATDGKLAAGNSATAGGRELFVDTSALARPNRRRRLAGTGLMPPESIAKRMAFLDERIVWESSTLKAYLQAKLLAEYDLPRVLASARRLLPKNAQKQSQRALLGWAFAAWQAHKSTPVEEALKLANLMLPTQAGAFKPARETFFGEGWPETRGDLTATFLREAPDTARSLRNMRDGLLPSWDAWPLCDKGTASEWTAFLRLLRVNDGLQVRCQSAAKLDYWQWVSFFDTDGPAHVPEVLIGKWWRRRMRATSAADGFTYKSKDWDTGNTLYFIAGQAEYENMSEAARLVYAKLIIAALPSMKGALVTVLTRSGGNAASIKLSSPIACFLDDAPWLPVGTSESPEWKQIRNCWVSTRQDPLPRFFPNIERTVRDMLDPAETRRLLTDKFGLRQWNEKGSSVRRLTELGAMLSRGLVPETEFDAFRSAYAKAWNDWRTLDPPPGLPTLFSVAVQSGGRLVAVLLDISEENPAIFLGDGSDSMREQMLESLGHKVLQLPRDVVAPAAEALAAAVGGTFRPASGAQVTIKLNGVAMEPRDAPPLVPKGCEWIAEFAVLINEFSPRSGHVPSARSRQAIYEEVMRLRLVFAEQVTVEIDGVEGEVPENLAGVLAAPDSEFPAIVMQDLPQELSWELLSRASRAMASALGRPGLHAVFRLGFLELEAFRRGMPFERPDDSSLASALCKPLSRVQEICRALRASNRRLLTILVPLSQALLGGTVGATLLERGDKFSDEAEIVRALQAAGADQERAARIVSTCLEAEDLDHARRLLEVTLPTLNGAIALLGSPWEPLRFESRLKRSFDKWVSAERGRLERMVRDSFIDIFDSGAPLTDYSRRKMLDWVSFDPSWVEEFDELPTDVIERRVAGLAGELLPTAQSAPEGSPDSVREKNRLLLVNSYQKISRLLGAWRAAGPGRTVHEVWSLGSEQTVRAAIASGALDFRVLDEGALPRELGRAGLWPEGMVLSLETSEHELGEADLLALDKKRDQDRQESLIAQRTVRFGEVDVDGGGGAPLQDVARALAHGVDDAAFFKRSGVASLAGFGVNVRTGGSGRAGRSARNADPEYMSAEQRELVGFAGEFAAYKYLRRNVRNFSDEFWVSSLGRRYLGLPVGDDSAGCDFHVKRAIRRPDLLFEVKASAGDPGFIDLEPSQVEAAASLATGDEAIWHVLYVTHVRSPSLIAVHELPNPFSVEGRKVLKPSGRQAMRFEFARK